MLTEHTPNGGAPPPRRSAGLPIHVLLVDDHPAVRRGVAQLIAAQPDMATIAQAGSATEAVGELARWADIAVIDYHLGGRDGLWLTHVIKQHPRPPRVLIYSAFADHALAVAAIIAGADGLLPKHALDEELCVALRNLARGRQHFPAIPDTLARALRACLASTDQPVFDMLLHGMDPRELTGRLQITPRELEERRLRILRTLAPNAAGVRMPDGAHAPLDYDRAGRRGRRAA